MAKPTKENKEVWIQAALDLDPITNDDPYEVEIERNRRRAIEVLARLDKEKLEAVTGKGRRRIRRISFADQQAEFLGGRSQARIIKAWANR